MSNPAFPLQLEGMRFKGNRDYLHGTDILPIALNALSGGEVSAIRDIDIVFHALSRKGLTLLADAPQADSIRVQLTCGLDGARRKFFMAEDDRAIVRRDPYDEDSIVAATKVDEGATEATSSGILPFTSIERWIAMTKALHHAVFPDAQGKWLFVRARLSSYRDAYTEDVEHRVSIKSGFGGKLTRSALVVGGRDLGDIFFALA